jgi:hypothetical protein
MVQTILFAAPELEHRLRSPELLGFLRRVQLHIKIEEPASDLLRRP